MQNAMAYQNRLKKSIGLFVLTGAAVFLSLQCQCSSKKPSRPVQAEPVITIRNVTKGRIHYLIKPSNSMEDAQKKTIHPGELHSYPSQVSLDFRAERVDSEIQRTLKPGQPYSLRYDENNLIQIYEGSHGRTDAEDLAPYVPTPRPVVEMMLELAEVDSEDIVFDIGCGDGRIVILAAEAYGARGVGIDIVPERIEEAEANAADAGVGDLVEFRLGDATKMDISEATVVTLYLLPESNELLRPQSKPHPVP